MQFENVTVIKAANIYLGGQVTSRTLIFPDGSKKTLGIIMPGEFTWNNTAQETKEIISGDLQVRFEGDADWKHYTAGSVLVVPPNTTAYYKIHTVTDYCYL